MMPRLSALSQLHASLRSPSSGCCLDILPRERGTRATGQTQDAGAVCTEEGLQTQEKAEVTEVLQKQKKKTGVLTLPLSI